MIVVADPAGPSRAVHTVRLHSLTRARLDNRH